MKRLHHVFVDAAVALFGRRRNSHSSSSSDNVTPFDNVYPDDASDMPIHDKSANNSIKELKGAVSLDNLGRANLRAVAHMEPGWLDGTLADIKIPDNFNELVFDAAEKEIKYLVLTNTWPKFVQVSRAKSEMSKEDPEKGNNAWMHKFLCHHP